MAKSHAAKLDLGAKPKPSVFCLFVKLISSAPQNCSRNEVFPGQLGAQAHICLQNPCVAIPLLHLSSQLWFTPSLSFFVLCPRIQPCQHPRPGSGTGQGHHAGPPVASQLTEGCFCRKLEDGQFEKLLENERNGSCFLFGSRRAAISARTSH